MDPGMAHFMIQSIYTKLNILFFILLCINRHKIFQTAKQIFRSMRKMAYLQRIPVRQLIFPAKGIIIDE